MERTFILPLFRTVILVLFGSLIVGENGAVGADRPSLESVIEGAKSTNHAFFESRQLSLRYERTATVNMTAARQMRRAEWLLGRDDGGWYCEARELEPGVRDGVTIPAEPTVNILKNGRFLDWTQDNRNVFLGPKETGNFNVLHGWQYLENAGLNPYRPVVESTGLLYEEAVALDETSMLHQFLRAPLLPEFLERNASRYNVAEAPESIDGEDCWLIEWPGMDKIWVNVDKGYAVQRRVYHWKPKGPLERQVNNSDFREVRSGLWFCFRQTVETYGRLDEDEGDWDKIVNRSTYEVRECDFSRAPKALTDVRLPVGTFVTDTIRNLQYTVSAEQGDPFEKPLGEAVEAAGVARRTGVIGPILIANAALLILVMLYILWRRKKAVAALLIALCNCAADTTAEETAVARATGDHVPLVDDKGEWLWKPGWMEMNACGPNALFVLLRLLGENVTLDQVKDLVKRDPVLGCNMADLCDAASALGVPSDVRFVRPSELAAVPVPYILHGTSGLKAKTGHFVVVVARDGVKHSLATIDPMLESFQWNPESGFMSDYSGYILVPRRHPVAKPGVWLAVGLTLILSGLVLHYRATGRRGSAQRKAMQCIVKELSTSS